jgi:hypothetical protein
MKLDGDSEGEIDGLVEDEWDEFLSEFDAAGDALVEASSRLRSDRVSRGSLYQLVRLVHERATRLERVAHRAGCTCVMRLPKAASDWPTILLVSSLAYERPDLAKRFDSWARACRYAALQKWSPRVFELNLWRRGVKQLARRSPRR